MAGLPGGLSAPAVVFHIATRSTWDAALATGSYLAPGYDADGFIHLSDPQQVVRVANARFRGARDLVLLCVAVDRLGAPLRYEPGDPGSDELFPHLYGPLEVDAVVRVLPFAEEADGFTLPPQAA
jgi:uncharacterized protein (DUF952 family)